jgi:Tat protein secretion system quality control protein TatD with DNase activity
VHPDNEGVLEPSVEHLVDRSALPRVVAVGETGLDYYRLDGRRFEDMEWQRERFRIHIRAALAADLPLVVHTRNAAADTLQILREEGGSSVGGVFHCFTETLETARAALDLGFAISFSGILIWRLYRFEARRTCRPMSGKWPMSWPASRAWASKSLRRRPARTSSGSSRGYLPELDQVVKKCLENC